MTLFYDLFRHDPDLTHVEEGDFLFCEGDEGNGRMYVLISGRVSIMVGGVVVEEARVGAILGEMALIEPGAQRSASVQADTDCGFVVIDEKRLQYLITEMPRFAIEVMRVLARRLRKADQTMTEMETSNHMAWRVALPSDHLDPEV